MPPKRKKSTAPAWRQRLLNIGAKLGIAAFLFFLIKGLIWLVIGGIVVWGFWG